MRKPDTKQFRKVLTDGFNPTALDALIMDNFDEVYNTLGTTDKAAKIQALLEYCNQNGCFQKLYEVLEEAAPKNQFEKYQSYFEGEQSKETNPNELTEEEKILDLIRRFDFSIRYDFQDFIEKQQGGIIIVHGQADYGHAWAFDILLRELQVEYENAYFDKIIKLNGKQNTMSVQHFLKGIYRQQLHEKPNPSFDDVEKLLKEGEKRVMLSSDLSKEEFLNLIGAEDFSLLSDCVAENKHFLFFFVTEEMNETDLEDLPKHWLFLPKLEATEKEVKDWIIALRSDGTRLYKKLNETSLCACCNNPSDVLYQISAQLSIPLNVYWT
jgi:hypothetical protein